MPESEPKYKYPALFALSFVRRQQKSPKAVRLRGLLVLLNLPENQIQRVSVIFGSKTMTDLSISTAFCRPSFWLMRLSSCSMLIA